MPSRLARLVVPLLALGLTGSALAAATPATAREVSPDRAERAAPYRIEPFGPRASDDDRLVRAWRAWRAQGLTHYTTTVRRSCECIQRPPVRTTVHGRRVTGVRYRGGRELRRHGWEMAALYRLLRRGYADADAVHVRFRDGVPRGLVIDWDEAVADEETVLSVKVAPVVEPQGRATKTAPYAVEPFRTRPSDPAALTRAWRVWRERHPARYVTVVRLRCFCSPSRAIRTEVVRQRVVSVRNPGRSCELRRHGYEMPELYRMLRGAYAQADHVQVHYQRGVPRVIAIDWDERAADEEMTYTVHLRTAGRQHSIS